MKTPDNVGTPRQTGEYVLGTTDEECARLGLQHQLWSSIAHDAWERAGIGPGMHILDIGCGPGFASTDLAQIVGPGGGIHGVDASERYVEIARTRAQGLGLENCVFSQGDACRLGDVAGIDGVEAVWTRWVLCFVPVQEVVQAVASILHPGGRWVIQDYFNWQAMRMAPPDAPHSDAYHTIKEASGRAWLEHGGDPDVMGSLPGLLRRAGFEVADLRVHQRIARPGTPMWAWPDSYWRSFVPRLVAEGFCSQADSDAFFEAWAACGADPDVFIHLPPLYEIIATHRSS